jgi:hypothetical protein
MSGTRSRSLDEPDESIAFDLPRQNDGSVLIEWVNTGTLGGSLIEIRGVDRYSAS